MQSFKEGLKYCVDRGRGCYCHGRDGYLCNSSSGEAGIILSGFVSHLASNFRAFKTAAHITSVSKKPGQTIVLYHYCGLSRFF